MPVPLRALLLATSLLSPTLASPALAHHPGGTGNSGGGGPVGTIPAETLEAGQVATFVQYEYIRLNPLSDQTLIAAAGRHEHAHSLRSIESTAIGAAFGITNDFSLSLRLPYVVRTDIREGAHSHDHGGVAHNTINARGDTAAFGDATLLGHWRFFDNPASGTSFALLGGLKLPTGRTGLRDNAGEVFETEFQPGSGSTDVLAGLAGSQRFGAWSLHANALYTFVNRGAQATDLGDRFHYNAAVAYRLFGPQGPAPALAAGVPAAYAHAGHDHASPRRRPVRKGAAPEPEHVEPGTAETLALDLVLEANGEWHDRQVVAGVTDPNSGGNVVYLSPGIRVSKAGGTGAGVSGFASVGIPVVNEVKGLQAKPSSRFVGGLVIAY